jgi:hypothetical protein
MKESNSIKWYKRGLVIVAILLAYGCARHLTGEAGAAFFWYNVVLFLLWTASRMPQRLEL